MFHIKQILEIIIILLRGLPLRMKFISESESFGPLIFDSRW